MKKVKYLSIVAFAGLSIFLITNHNAIYKNCMKATTLDYISKEGAAHIASQCNAFIKDKLYVK
jgi:hypothetical protein